MSVKQALRRIFIAPRHVKRTEGTSVQSQAGPKRVHSSDATKPPSLRVRLIQRLTANPVRIQREKEVRETLAKAGEKLSNVFLEAMVSKDAEATQKRWNEFIAVLTPLAEKMAEESVKKAGASTSSTPSDQATAKRTKDEAAVDLIGNVLLKRMGKMEPAYFVPLDKRLGELRQSGLDENRITILAFVVRAAVLDQQAKKMEAEGTEVFAGTNPTVMTGRSIADLRKLSGMKEAANDLVGLLKDFDPAGTAYPRTKLTHDKLLTIQTKGIAAETELAQRKARLTAAESDLTSLKSMTVDELEKLSQSVEDWVKEFPSESNKLNALQTAVAQQLRSQKATKELNDPVGTFDVKLLASKDLVPLRNKIAGLGDRPDALEVTLSAIERQIALRSADSKTRALDELKTVLQRAVQLAATQGADMTQTREQLLRCAIPLQRAQTTLALLGEDLSPAQITTWIRTALQEPATFNVSSLKTMQTSLNDSEGKKLRKDASTIDHPMSKFASQVLELLSSTVDTLLVIAEADPANNRSGQPSADVTARVNRSNSG